MAMDIDVEAHGHEEHPPTTIRQYVLIGVLLTAVTAAELWASYNVGILGAALVPALLVMSAFKFAVVVALFMHLKFEHKLLTQVFVFGLVLAACIMVALMTLFYTNESDIVGNANHGGQGVAAEAHPAAPKH